GSATQTFSGGLTVGAAGTLTLASSTSSAQIGANKTLTINATLNASNTGAAISCATSGSKYTFQMGTTAISTPTINITGLQVKDLLTGGMPVNTKTSSTHTFPAFDNVAFSNGTSGSSLLTIYSKTLSLSSTGCTFDAGATTGTT